MNKNQRIAFLILLGLIIRLILISIPGYKFDIDAWFAWAIRLNEVGFSQFYSTEIWTNYTPGFLYILWFLGLIKELLNINNQDFYLILKIPSIIAELFLAFFIYKQIAKKSLSWATIAASMVLFNPAFIFNSSIWGQIDGLLSLTMLLAVYLLTQHKLVFSSVFLGLSFLIKPQTVALAPVFLLFLVKNLSIRNILKLCLPFMLVVFVLSLPFFTNQHLLGLLRLFFQMTSDYPYTSLFAYNLWGVVGFWIPDSQLWLNIPYQAWGYLIYALFWLTTGYFYFKRKLSLYALSALGTLSFFFLPTRVHERYLYPAIVFLIMLSAFYKSRILLILTGILSLLHFINLYHAYIDSYETYLKLPSLLNHPFVYNLLTKNSQNFSLISTTIFIFISIYIIKYDNVLFKKN